MRIRLPLGRTLFFVCAFLFSLLALLPLRLALDWLTLDDRGFAAREAQGSIWLGSLSEAQIGTVALGDLTAQLRTLPLFLGRARVDLSRADEQNPFVGSATVSRHSFGVDDMTARLQIGSALAPLPVGGVDLSDMTAHFADGQCTSAEGLVRADIAGDVGGLTLPGGLSGNARCDRGALLLPLVSQSGMEALNLRLFEDGRYELELAVRPADDAMRDRLIAAGFALGATGYALRSSGRF
ncbi:MAG TPA: type II secretion system protein N [Allosphingosinicella sp.]|uniref:type II secretion system protein N n=1 Tax=Allosphingosinicella sp. TaxID=2823234 RepID=UPI002F2A1705